MSEEIKERMEEAGRKIKISEKHAQVIFNDLNERLGLHMEEFTEQVQFEVKELISESICDAINESNN